jgi:nucleotide-binding universal stress UspA family protein
MTHFRKILFPVALSHSVAGLAPSVKEIAQRFDASVILLNAFNPVPEYFFGPSSETPCGSKERPIFFSPELQRVRNRQERRLEKFAQAHFSGIRHSARIVDGNPARVIEWVAKCEDIDLVMMPTGGLGMFRRFLISSVTSKILHDVACPVWISNHRLERAWASPAEYHSILCAIKMSQEDDAVLETASLFAQAYGARLCLLHIRSVSNEDCEQCTSQTIRQAFDRVCRAKGWRISTDVCVRILNGEKTSDIRPTASEQDADLIIVGRGRDRGAFSRAFSQLCTIIRESPCPVLSV